MRFELSELKKDVICVRLPVFLLIATILWAFPAAAGPPGVKLVVSPPNLMFRVPSPLVAGATAGADLMIQVVAQPRQSWRLTVQALGPLLSGEGAQMTAGEMRWRGSPGTIFLDGVLSPGSPQLCGRGEGPKSGVLHFLAQPGEGTNAGNYRQKLLFSLSSP
jgi:hypothetical protein